VTVDEANAERALAQVLTALVEHQQKTLALLREAKTAALVLRRVRARTGAGAA